MRDADYIERAVSLYGDSVLRFACNLLQSYQAAEDVTQDTFVKLAESTKDFANDTHMRHWLFAVARNRCLDILRQQKCFAMDLTNPAANGELNRLTVFGGVSQSDFTVLDPDHYLWRHVAQLPTQQREVVYLRYVEGLKPREIAKVLNVSGVNVRQRLSRALKKLRGMLDEEPIHPKEVSNHEFDRWEIRNVSQRKSIS